MTSIFAYAQIEDTDIDPSMSMIVVLENGTIESVTYYRLNYTERINGQTVNQRTHPMVVDDFLPFAYS